MSELDLIGQQARSREGRGLSMKGGVGESDKWITIQQNTFTNWMNLQLQGSDLIVEDLHTDLCDGVKLCVLVEKLQKKKVGRVIKKPMNQHQYLENVTLALNAIAQDNVRLVNIGSEDIVNPNKKLILGLIWHLILRYQIGKTKMPPKKLMLAWLHAVLPDCRINNFTSDWNDGVSLHALLDYCDPGLCSSWRSLSPNNRLENCTNAMMLAKQHFNIPLIVRPEDFCSPHLDELSGMTYLSYYMNVDSPGYLATKKNLNMMLTGSPIDNFTTDWNDGKVLCQLVKNVGGNVRGWPHLGNNPEENLEAGIDGAKGIGVDPILSAKEMSEAEVEHLGIMAYAAYFTRLTPVKSLAEKAVIDGQFQHVFVGQEKSFQLKIDDDVSPGDFRAEVIGPDSLPPVHLNWSGRTAHSTFTPSETGQHRLNVYCNNDPISGCPINFRVSSDRSKVSFHPVDRCVVGVPTELKVDTSAAGQGDVRVESRTPSGKNINLPVTYRQGVYTANFTPSEVGDHLVSVHYDGDHINGSPFKVNAFDPNAVRVYGLEGGSVGRALSFNVDSSQAGDGDLRVAVTHDDANIPCYTSSEGTGLHKIDFTPQGAGVYKINVFYNEIEVRGSPYTLEIVDSSLVTVSGDGLSLVPVNRAATFNVQTRGAGGGNVSVDITSPDGINIPTEIVNEGSEEFKVQYVPKEVGEHTIHVKCGSTEAGGSPFTAKAYNTHAIVVSSLEDGYVNRPIKFTIDVRKAGEGQLQIMVNNGNLPNEVELPEAGVYEISFIPTEPGRHQVDISFNDESLSSSPMSCDVIDPTAEVVELRTLQCVEEETQFLIKTQVSYEMNSGASCTITSPNGEQVPARLIPQQDGDFKVEWTPVMAGRHSVDVSFAGQQIQGSPFYIEVFDINKIRVDNFYNGSVGDPAGFNVDASHAGVAEHNIQVMGPTGRNVPVEVIEHRAGEFSATYVPNEVGPHKIYMSFGGLEFPGSPFTQEIGEGVLPTAHGEGLYHGEEDKPTTFYIESSGIVGEPAVRVDGPNSIAKCSVDPQPDGRYSVTYVPVEVGMFDVEVLWNSKHIHGSPFHPKIVDPRKVRVVGGWQHYMDAQERIKLIVNEEKQIPFDCSEAGPGKLSAEIKSPSGSVPCRIDDHNVGNSIVCFTPREEGKHHVHVHWADIPISNSPFLGYASSGAPDISKVILTGRGLKEAVVREEAEFIIDGSQAGTGDPEVQLTGVKAEVNVFVTSLGGGKFRCTYIPTIPGAYLLHISWNGRQLHGSPYKVNVIGAFYPNKVIVGGEGLKGGLLGRELDIRIDTRKAGPGELAAYCMGPNKAAYCELEDNQNGTYRLCVRAQETGRHILQVKYGGEHVHGSPFVFRVSAQPDASKVRVSGPGVEYGILATFQSRFIVETRGAGAGQLMVRIRGPKGAFQVEMYRDSQKDRTILCRYDPVECGLYIVNVKWSNVDVPGSPFHVHIVDTQAELEQCMQEASYNSTLPSSRSGYSQWREDI